MEGVGEPVGRDVPAARSTGRDAAGRVLRNHAFAAKAAKGVQRRGPAWNSGLRDGMALESWTFAPGDMTQMIELRVRNASTKGRAKPRTIAYWPYGDATQETRRLQLTPGMSATATTDCGAKIAGR